MSAYPSPDLTQSLRSYVQTSAAWSDWYVDAPEDHLSQCGCHVCGASDGLLDDTERSGTGSTGGTSSSAQTASLGEMADFLRLDYWGSSTGTFHNVSSTGTDANNGVLHYNVAGYTSLSRGGTIDQDGVTEERAELIRDAFDLFSAVLGIQFVETTSQDDDIVDFFFSDNASGAYAGSRGFGGGVIDYSYINIAAGWSGGTSTFDDYTFQTILHEIGHALGLGHQGFYNGSARYDTDAEYELDSWQASMMSYFSQSENTAIDAKYEFLQTPMAVDWLALDAIYGPQGYGVSNAFTDDTTYGFNTTITAEESKVWSSYAEYAGKTASTIVDGDGIDTLDVSGFSADQKIDLTVQTADQTVQNTSNIGGSRGNLTLSIGTVIENAIGGSGNDEIIGNDADNVLKGGDGDDRLLGKDGDDRIYGNSGFDTVLYESNFDAYIFSTFNTAIKVIGDGVDLVFSTIESFEFADVSYSFGDILDLYADVPPEAVDDAFEVGEAELASFDVLANDTDANLDDLSVAEVDGQTIVVGEGVTLASGATVTLQADGRLQYDQNGSFDSLLTGQTAADHFTYVVSDGKGNSDEANVSVSIAGDGTPPPPDPIGQSGNITVTQSSKNEWFTVTFDAAIENAIVVLGPLSFNGAEAATTRVRNVTDTGFEFQVDEWNFLDGAHTTETLSWLAISEGTHTLADGQTVTAGSNVLNTTFTEIGFGASLNNAVVLAEVTTANGSDAVTTRIRNVDNDSFELRLQEEEALGPHLNETISWIAFESGQGAGIDVSLTGNQVGSDGDSFAFNTGFDAAPVLLADMQTTNGWDTATVRLTDKTDAGLSLFIEEEASRDAEKFHLDESVGYVALEEGLIF